MVILTLLFGLLKIIDAGSTGSRLHVFEFVASSSDGDMSSDENSSEERRVQCLRMGTSRASCTPPSTFAPAMDDNERSNATRSDAKSSKERRVQCLRRGSSKAWTPLSTFAADIDDYGRLNATHVAQHMLPLFDYATNTIPQMYHSTTPVRISCTAGMRLLPLDDQNRVYDALFEGLREQSTTGKFSFIDLKREDVFTLDGERQQKFVKYPGAQR